MKLWQLICPIFYMLLPSLSSEIVYQQEPQDAIVRLGNPAVISCAATTTLLNSVLVPSWKHNDSYIVDFTKKHFHLLENGSLFITHFLPRDSGYYQCITTVIVSGVRMEQKESAKATLRFASIGQSFLLITPLIHETIGSKVHLQCTSPKSYPLASITWTKDGKNLTGFLNQTSFHNARTSSTLQITTLDFGDVGNYCCIAHNDLLSVHVTSKTIPVKIKANQNKPYFIEEPTSVIAHRYKQSILRCFIMGDPVPQITWFKNNQTILNNTNLLLLGNGSLLFTRVDNSDEGIYECMGSNEYGFIKSVPVSFTVAYIDYDFIQNPQDTVAILTHSFIIHCMPPVSYPTKTIVKWFKGLHEIIYSTVVYKLDNNSLLVRSAKLSDDGLYHCEATNRITNEVRSSQRAKVTVTIIPSVFIWKTLDIILQNTSFEIICNATGVPLPSLKLFKLVDNKSSWQQVSSTGRLVFNGVSFHNEGVYKCVGENLAGKDQMNTTVVIQTSPTLQVAPKRNISQSSLTSVYINCSYTSLPPPIVYWSFTNLLNHTVNLTTTSTRYKIDNRGLTMHSLVVADEGAYSCHGYNNIGYLKTTSYLNVLTAPRLHVDNSSIVTNINDDVILSCKAISDPLAVIVWRRNGVTGNTDLVSSNKSSYYTQGEFLLHSELRLSNVQLTDAGQYFCYAYNDLGSANQTILVTVQVPPSIELTIEGSFQLNGSMLIKCSSFAIPLATLSIVHNGSIVIASSTDRNYTQVEISKLTSKHSGNYNCKATNLLGTAEMDRNITVKVPPLAPVLSIIKAISSTSVNLSWISPFDGYSPLLPYIIEISKNDNNWLLVTDVVSANDRYYVKSGLSPYTEYAFRMRSRNDIGLSGYSNVVTTKTWPSAPSVPLNLTTSTITPVNIHMNWLAPNSKNGPIDVYELIYYRFNGNMTSTINITSSRMRTYVLQGLFPYTVYKIQMRAANFHVYNTILLWSSYSNILTAQTKATVPSAIIQGLKTSNVTLYGFHVSFLKPIQNINGRLVGYRLKQSSNGIDVITFINTTSYDVNGLESYTVYLLSVAVVNHMGEGLYTSPVKVTTFPTVPGRIQHLLLTYENQSIVMLSWKPPFGNHPKSLYFNISVVNSTNFTLVANYITKTNFIFLHGLSYNKSYTVFVTAGHHIGLSSQYVQLTFVKAFIDDITTLAPTTTLLPSVRQTWLQREYMVVIIAVSALSLCLIAVLIVILTRMCRRSRKKMTQPRDTNRDWEVNFYYDHPNTQETEENTKPSEAPTLRIHDFREDFIWSDDDTTNSSSRRSTLQSNNTKQPIYEVTSPKYASVEPYQGKQVELSPFVKLKGVPKKQNKKRPPLPNIDGRTHKSTQSSPRTSKQSFQRRVSAITDTPQNRRYAGNEVAHNPTNIDSSSTLERRTNNNNTVPPNVHYRKTKNNGDDNVRILENLGGCQQVDYNFVF